MYVQRQLWPPVRTALTTSHAEPYDRPRQVLEAKMIRRHAGTPLLTLALGCCLSATVWGQHAKLSRELQSLDPADGIDVIVQYNHAPADDDDRRVISGGG